MHRGYPLLLPFIGASFAAHLALLLYPVAAPVSPASVRGDAGLQVTLTRSLAGTRPAAALPAAASAVRPQPETPSPQPAPVARMPAVTRAAALPLQPPAAAAPAAPATTPSPATARETRIAPGVPLLASLREAMQPHFHYPLLARRRGWEGTVRIGLHISANGEISRLRVVETSRHAVLDRAALDCLSKLRQMPGAVAWLDGHDSDIVLPVEYRLTDG